MPWPGGVADKQLPPEYRANDAASAAALKTALLAWCGRNHAQEDVKQLAKADAGRRQMLSPAILPPIPQPQTNPFYRSAMEAAKGFVESPGKSDAYPDMALAFVHPQSAYSGSPVLLVALLDYLDTVAEGKKDLTGQFDIPRPARVYLLLRHAYPGLIPPSRQQRWEAALRALAQVSLKRTERCLPERPRMVCNLDSNDMLVLADLGTALGDGTYLERARRICAAIALHQLDDGAHCYDSECMPAIHYHSVMTRNLTQYWLLTGDPVAREQMLRMWWWWPSVLRPAALTGSERSVGLDITNVDWKKEFGIYRNYNDRACASAYVTAMVDGSGENLGLPDAQRAIRAGRVEDQTLLIGAALWRTDIVPVALPRDFLYFDRNYLGPNGRFGDFSVIGAARTQSLFWHDPCVEGKETYVGCMMTPPGRPAVSLYAVEGAVQVRAGPWTNPNTSAGHRYEEETGFAMHHHREAAAASVWRLGDGAPVGALCGSHLVTMAKIVLGEMDKQALPCRVSEAWAFTPQRLIGIVRVEAEADIDAFALVAGLHFASTAGGNNGATGAPVEAAPGRFVLDPIEVVIGPSTFAPQAVWKNDEEQTLELVDPVAAKAGRNKRTYKAGSAYWAILDIHPQARGPAQGVAVLAARNGLIGFDFVEEGRHLRLVANPGAKPLAYAGGAWAGVGGKVLAIPSGTAFRPDWLRAFQFPYPGALTAKNLTPLAATVPSEVAASAGFEVQPAQHVLLVSR